MDTDTTVPPLDPPAAVRLLYATLEQWTAAVRLGLDLNCTHNRDLLTLDLAQMKAATDVLADRR